MRDQVSLQSPLASWPDALEGVLLARGEPASKVIVIRETASTQDVARAQGEVGTVVAAWRQTGGRGRLGRAWLDTGEEGVAVSFVVARDTPVRLATASACATAMAIERTVQRASGAVPALSIKWPNDILSVGKKLAGILVEQDGRAATIGIGINVLQRQFPADLAARAISLCQCGHHVDRLQLILSLCSTLHECLAMDDEALRGCYQSRDCLRGRNARFSTPEGVVEGVVRSVDPAQGLEVATSAGTRFLSPSTTSMLLHEERFEGGREL